MVDSIYPFGQNGPKTISINIFKCNHFCVQTNGNRFIGTEGHLWTLINRFRKWHIFTKLIASFTRPNRKTISWLPFLFFLWFFNSQISKFTWICVVINLIFDICANFELRHISLWFIVHLYRFGSSFFFRLFSMFFLLLLLLFPLTHPIELNCIRSKKIYFRRLLLLSQINFFFRLWTCDECKIEIKDRKWEKMIIFFCEFSPNQTKKKNKNKNENTKKYILNIVWHCSFLIHYHYWCSTISSRFVFFSFSHGSQSLLLFSLCFFFIISFYPWFSHTCRFNYIDVYSCAS